MVMSPEIFFPPFSQKMLLFSKKLLDEKYSKPHSPLKKVILIFITKRTLRFKRDLGPRNGFLPFSQIQLFLKKLLNNKIFSTSFVIKKSHVNFGYKTPPFLKQLSNVPQFFTVFSENTAFFVKIVE